jgi:hypothetical protein
MKTRIGFALFKLVVAPLELTSQPNNARATAPELVFGGGLRFPLANFVDYLDLAVASSQIRVATTLHFEASGSEAEQISGRS